MENAILSGLLRAKQACFGWQWEQGGWGRWPSNSTTRARSGRCGRPRVGGTTGEQAGPEHDSNQGIEAVRGRRDRSGKKKCVHGLGINPVGSSGRPPRGEPDQAPPLSLFVSHTLPHRPNRNRTTRFAPDPPITVADPARDAADGEPNAVPTPQPPQTPPGNVDHIGLLPSLGRSRLKTEQPGTWWHIRKRTANGCERNSYSDKGDLSKPYLCSPAAQLGGLEARSLRASSQPPSHPLLIPTYLTYLVAAGVAQPDAHTSRLTCGLSPDGNSAPEPAVVERPLTSHVPLSSLAEPALLRTRVDPGTVPADASRQGTHRNRPRPQTDRPVAPSSSPCRPWPRP